MLEFINYLNDLGFSKTSEGIYRLARQGGWVEIIIDGQTQTAQKITVSKSKDHPGKGAFVAFDMMRRWLHDQLK